MSTNKDFFKQFTKYCICNDLKKIKNLITKENVNSKNDNGYTPLHIASKLGNMNIINELIKVGADIFEKDNEGNGILFFAKNNISNGTFYLAKNNTKHSNLCFVENKGINYEYLMSIIIVKSFIIDNDNKYNIWDLIYELKEFNLELLVFSINYILANNKSFRKKAFDSLITNEEEEKEKLKYVEKLKNFFNKFNIKIKNQDDFINNLNKMNDCLDEFDSIGVFLLYSCLFGNTTIVKFLIENKAILVKEKLKKRNLSEESVQSKVKEIITKYVNVESSSKWTPLHCSCEIRNKDINKILLENGAKITNIESLLYKSICEQNTEVLEILIQNRVIEKIKDDDLRCLFASLISRDLKEKIINKDVIKLLLKGGFFSKEIFDNETLINTIIEHRKIHRYSKINNILHLIAKEDKKKLELETTNGFTPLIIAILRKDKKMIQFLLNNSTNIVTSEQNAIQLTYTLRMINKDNSKKENQEIERLVVREIIKKLMVAVNNADNKNNIKDDIYFNETEKMYLLYNIINYSEENLDKLCDEFLKFVSNKYHKKLLPKYKGNTLLHQACSLNTCKIYLFESILEYLVDKSKLLTANAEGKTPVDILIEHDKNLSSFVLRDRILSKLKNEILDAINENNLDKIKLAINENNNIAMNMKHDGQSLLWYACNSLRENIAMYLVSLGFDINERNKDTKDTLLMFACEQGLNNLSNKLITIGADTYAKNNEGVDILQTACKVGNKKVLSELGEYTLKSLDRKLGKDKQTMLIIASEYCNKEVVDYLLDNGANYSLKDKNEKTAIMYAYDWENYEIITSLLNKGADPKDHYLESNNLTKIQKWLKSYNKEKNKTVSKIKTIASELVEKPKENNLSL